MHHRTFAVGALAGALVSLSLAAVSLSQGTPQGTRTRTTGPITPAGADDATALAKLNQLVGSWSVVGAAQGPDGSAQGEFQGESHFGWTLGGNFISGDHALWNAQGAQLQTIDAMGFTPGVGFTRSEMTNGDRSMFIFAGRYDAAVDAIVFESTNSLLTASGQSRALQVSFTFKDDGSVVWNTRFVVAGANAGIVSLTLTPSASSPSPSAPSVAPSAPNSPPDLAQMKSTMSGMLQQRQQMQSQMNQMQQQVQDMSRMMSSGLSQ